MAAQVALKRQQAAEDAIALGLRACAEGTLPMLTPGPLWGPGTVSPPEEQDRRMENDKENKEAGENNNKGWHLILIISLWHEVLKQQKRC